MGLYGCKRTHLRTQIHAPILIDKYPYSFAVFIFQKARVIYTDTAYVIHLSRFNTAIKRSKVMTTFVTLPKMKYEFVLLPE